MRIRTIKPEIWTDRKFVGLSLPARLLFIALFNYVDDHGRCEWDPYEARLRLFPSDPLDLDEVSRELVESSMVLVYKVGENSYLQVKNFAKHQKIDRKGLSHVPPPPLDESSMSPRDPSRSLALEGKGGDQGKDQGREGEGKPAPPVVEKSKRQDPRQHVLIERIKKELLDPSEQALDEWMGLVRQAKIKDYDEAAAFLTFAVAQARSQGIGRPYPRHVQHLAQAWREWARDRHWRQPPEEKAS